MKHGMSNSILHMFLVYNVLKETNLNKNVQIKTKSSYNATIQINRSHDAYKYAKDWIYSNIYLTFTY